MADRRHNENIIKMLKAFKSVTTAYSQIASIRMKKIRQEVLTDREYIERITSVFDEVRRSFAYEIKLLSKTRKRRDKTNITMLAHNGRNVLLLLSSKTGLYGDIVNKTYKLFLEDVKKGKGEVALVGRQALMRFQADMPHSAYTYFDLPDINYKETDTRKIISHIVPYETITVYYGKFISLIHQVPETLFISSTIRIDEKEEVVKSKYLFEPDLEKILKFFELEIFISLFGQAMRESALAKQASRAYSMEKAGDKIKNRIHKTEQILLLQKHLASSRAQLNALNGILRSYES